MALDPVQPSLPNPNPNLNPPKTPPNKPPDGPDPLISTPNNFFMTLFLGYIIPGVPSNPYWGLIPNELREEHQKSLNRAKETIKGPFTFQLIRPLELTNQDIGA